MKVKIPLVVLLFLAAAIGYLLGTERGRAQREVILVKLGRKPGEDEEPSPEIQTVGTEATETDGAEATEPTA